MTISRSPISTPSGTSPPPSTPSSAALSTVGQVYRLEADESFPARLALLRPDFVFNIAEGLYGPNREGHVPAICEFLGVPYHASDPLTLGLALDKRRAKEVLTLPRRAHRPVRRWPTARPTPARCTCRSRSS